MANNQEFCEAKQGESCIKLVSPDYVEAFRDCATDSAFSLAWTMQAAAMVLRREIVSIYPSLNGVLDWCVAILNRTFQPRTKATGRPVYIMWSSTYYPKTGYTWTPNQFVPLLIDPDQVCICEQSKHLVDAGFSKILINRKIESHQYCIYDQNIEYRYIVFTFSRSVIQVYDAMIPQTLLRHVK